MISMCLFRTIRPKDPPGDEQVSLPQDLYYMAEGLKASAAE